MFRPILVPMDGSEHGGEALRAIVILVEAILPMGFSSNIQFMPDSRRDSQLQFW